MQDAVVHKVRQRVARGKYGEVYFPATFAQYDTEYITKVLGALEHEGLLTRIAKGVYVKARRTRFGVVFPSAYEIVRELAKRDKAKILPTGSTAANRLGLSTQVPMNASFLTTGSSRKLTLGTRTVTLKHGAPRNFAFHSPAMAELVQALRSIGEDNVSKSHHDTIRKLLASVDTQTLNHDIGIAPAWMARLVMEIMKEENA